MNSGDGTLARLVNQHLTDDRWNEVFLLTASLLPNADTFFVLFRQAIHNLIEVDDRLVQIVKWANRKADRDYRDSGSTGREGAFLLVCTLTHTLIIASILLHARDRKRDHALIHALNLNFKLALPPVFAPFIPILTQQNVCSTIKGNLSFRLKEAYYYENQPDECLNRRSGQSP